MPLSLYPVFSASPLSFARERPLPVFWTVPGSVTLASASRAIEIQQLLTAVNPVFTFAEGAEQFG